MKALTPGMVEILDQLARGNRVLGFGFPLYQFRQGRDVLMKSRVYGLLRRGLIAYEGGLPRMGDNYALVITHEGRATLHRVEILAKEGES